MNQAQSSATPTHQVLSLTESATYVLACVKNKQLKTAKAVVAAIEEQHKHFSETLHTALLVTVRELGRPLFAEYPFLEEAVGVKADTTD